MPFPHMCGVPRSSPDQLRHSSLHDTNATCSRFPQSNRSSPGGQVLPTCAPPRAWQRARFRWCVPLPEGSPSSLGTRHTPQSQLQFHSISDASPTTCCPRGPTFLVVTVSAPGPRSLISSHSSPPQSLAVFETLPAATTRLSSLTAQHTWGNGKGNASAKPLPAGSPGTPVLPLPPCQRPRATGATTLLR